MIEYFTQNLWQPWALVALLCLILELSSGDFVIMCFGIGAAASAVCAAFGMNFTGELIIFAIASVLSLFFVRPMVKKWLHGDKAPARSNADAIIGKTGKVTETIPADDFGRAAIGGDDWKARSTDGSSIEKGVRVRVVSRESLIVTVEKVEN